MKFRHDQLMKLADRTYEPFFEEYHHHLKCLLSIFYEIGEPMEGNIFYLWDKSIDKGLDPNYLNKRRNLALMAGCKKNVLEIGFNCGFSALLLLTANPDLNYTAIDICAHKYTVPCFDYLKSQFGERIRLFQGNSLTTLPYVLHKESQYDAYIIDGGHGIDVAEADLLTVITHAVRGSLICFDDTQYPHLRLLVNSYMMDGKVAHISDQVGFIAGIDQMFLLRM